MDIPEDLIPLPTMPFDERPVSMPLEVEECRTALWYVSGNIAEAAKILKTTSGRLRTFVKNSPRLTAECAEAREVMQDTAEAVVSEALTDTSDNNRRDTMARFVLTNLGGFRGYGASKAGINLKLPQSGTMEISWGDGSVIQDNDSPVIEGESQRG